MRNKTRRIRRHHPAPAILPQHKLKLTTNLLTSMHAKIELPPPYDSIKPGNDFYKYVNGKWMATAPIPKYTSSYGISEEVDKQIEAVLLKDIEEYQRLAEIGREATTPENKQGDAIGRLAMSALRPSKQINSVDYLKRGIRSIGCMRDTADAARALGKMCRYSIATIIDISIYQYANKFYINIEPGSMGLPDASYRRHNECHSYRGTFRTDLGLFEKRFKIYKSHWLGTQTALQAYSMGHTL